MSDASDADADTDLENDIDEGPDAVALFRPMRAEALKPFLDLDDDAEDSEGIYAEELEDGSFLLYTFQPYSLFQQPGPDALQWLAQFGGALAEVHDDDRGYLFFPDDLEPDATTYDGVVAEIGDKGTWLPPFDVELPEGFAEAMQGVDMGALQALAGQLLNATTDGSGAPPSQADLAKMLSGLQEQLAATLGVQMPTMTGAPGAEAEDDTDAETPASKRIPPKSS